MIEIFILLIIASAIFGIPFSRRNKYKETTYYQITKNSYSSIKNDIGKYGEYLVYEKLRPFENSGGKFLFNVYIPKFNGGATEIDILLICSKGLFVIESKNYKGWIFGNETNRNWTRTLPRGRGRNSSKEYFYNPIRQNAGHIKHLKKFIENNIPIYSIIVFSDECKFKNVPHNDIRIVYRRHALSAIRKICKKTKTDVLTQNEINALYKKLYPCTQPDSETINQHIDSIKNY